MNFHVPVANGTGGSRVTWMNSVGGSSVSNCAEPDQRLAQIRDDYQRQISQLAAENEELKSEIYLINHDLRKAIEEKEELQRLHEEQVRKLTEQLNIVTRTAYALFDKIRQFKHRYYTNAWTQAQQRCE